jgi:glycosyltransferase involved in cell wall biosynthesis
MRKNNKRKVIVDPLYLVNSRGIGRVSRDIHKATSNGHNRPSSPRAIFWSRNYILHLIAEQLFYPILLWRLGKVHFIATGSTLPYFVPSSTKVTFVLHDLHFQNILSDKSSGYNVVQKLGAAYRKFCLGLAINREYEIICISNTTHKFLKNYLFELGINNHSSYITVIQNKVHGEIDQNFIENRMKSVVFFCGASPTKNFSSIRHLLDKNLPEILEIFAEIHVIGNSHSISHPKIFYHINMAEDQLKNLLKNSSTVVVPSLMEGFGLPVIEAMQAGCLTVASNIPAFKEILEDTGIFFDPFDPKSILVALEMLRDKETFKSILDRQRVRFLELRDEGDMYDDKWQNLLDRVK